MLNFSMWNWNFSRENQISHVNHGIYQLICENSYVKSYLMMTGPLPETFLSNLSSRTLHKYSHLCNEAVNCSQPCGLNTVDILYFDKFETTCIYNSLDNAPDNLRYFHSWCWKLQTDRIWYMLCLFLLLWRIGVGCWSMTHWYVIL